VTANVFGLRLLGRPAVQVSILVVLAVLALAFRALQFWVLTGEIQWGYDFSFYWLAGRRLLEGEPIYSATQLAGPYSPQGQDGFLYPPPLAAVITPLSALFETDYRPANWIWAAMGAAVLVASVLAVTRAERLGERYPLLAGHRRWLLVAAAFAFPPVVGELVMGNVHLLLLGLFAIAWLAVRSDNPNREWTAGLAIGVAAVVKVFPGLLIVWFLASRRYRAAAGVVIGALVVAVATLEFTGLEPWQQYPTVLANLSAPADVTDTLAPTVWLAPVLGFDLARWVVLGAGLSLMAIVGLAARRDVPSTRPTTLAASFGVAITVSVLVAPALYHHYLAIMVLPLLLGLVAGVPVRWLALAYLLMWGGQQDALGEWSWVVNRGLPTAGALVLFGALVLRLRRLPAPAQPSGERDPVPVQVVR
jgi:hypothetical protein